MELDIKNITIYTLWDELLGDFNFIKDEKGLVWCVARDLDKILSKKQSVCSCYLRIEYKNSKKQINIAGRKITVFDYDLTNFLLKKEMLNHEDCVKFKEDIATNLLEYYKILISY